MKKLEIKTNQEEYSVYIGTHNLNILNNYLNKDNKLLIITDERVNQLHLHKLMSELEDYTVYTYILSQTPEDNKNLNSYQSLLDFALNQYLDRKISVIAFGGGAVGDFAGFFAATYKRGVDLYHLPTTLLAHDSSVGGKVALNHNGVKNTIGSFYQPKAVIYDVNLLKTLSRRELLSGFAEMIKHDLLDSGKLVSQLTDIDEIFNHEEQLIEQLYEAIKIKYQYIKDDVTDQKGLREFLNIGHTVGHSLESLYGYSHGEAILFGTCFDLYLTDQELGIKLFNQFNQLGYFKNKEEFEIRKMIHNMRNDKKNINQDSITFISLKAYGKPYRLTLTTDEFMKQFELFLNLINW